MITKELIEDALVHLDDMGFKYTIEIGLFKRISAIGSNGSRYPTYNRNLYDLLKSSDVHDQELSCVAEVSIVRSDNVYNFTTWQTINSEISTAIKRITRELEGVTIGTSRSEFSIEIPMSKSFKLSNIQEACNIFKSFNNLYSPMLVMYPEFNHKKGVSVYIRETPRSKDHVRFDFLNNNTNRAKEFIDDNFNIVKTYEDEDDVLKDNTYLVEKNSSLSKYIVCELELKKIKLC